MIEPPALGHEMTAWGRGQSLVAGVDEAGRGAWAGPLVAAAVILPAGAELEHSLAGVRDSKKMTAAQRARWAPLIKSVCVTWAVGQCPADEIDRIGILPANRLAMARAIDGLAQTPQYCLLDFIHWKDCPYPGERLVRGEQQSLSIAAASVLAKTARDELMCGFEDGYPGYGFARHKGYGTRAHYAAIRELGMCAIHRRSFSITGWGSRQAETG